MDHSEEERADEVSEHDPSIGIGSDDVTIADAAEIDAEELSQKEQNARSLAVFRAIEQRMEEKRLDEDLGYLNLDPLDLDLDE